jgi:hypothetical protein
MSTFRIYRMKETTRQQFRWAPHSSGCAQVKPRDYEEDGDIEGASFYAVWSALRETERKLLVGDLLERDGGDLRIYKYVGFDEARWLTPETKAADSAPVAVDGSHLAESSWQLSGKEHGV